MPRAMRQPPRGHGGHVALWVLLATLLLLAVAMLIPVERRIDPSDFPWSVTPTGDGGSRVFGLTLGRSTLREAEQRFQAPAEISLFLSPDGQYAAEAYFDKVNLAGLGARIVLTAGLSQEELKALFDAGERISTLGDGTRKVTLSGEGLAAVYSAPIAALTYLPKVQLDRELLEKRFGPPAERLREQGSGVEHWLYPERGLDIALSETEKEVLQFVPPRDFERLVTPLHSTGEK